MKKLSNKLAQLKNIVVYLHPFLAVTLYKTESDEQE